MVPKLIRPKQRLRISTNCEELRENGEETADSVFFCINGTEGIELFEGSAIPETRNLNLTTTDERIALDLMSDN